MSIQSIGNRAPAFSMPAETQAATKQTQAAQSETAQPAVQNESSPEQVQDACRA